MIAREYACPNCDAPLSDPTDYHCGCSREQRAAPIDGPRPKSWTPAKHAAADARIKLGNLDGETALLVAAVLAEVAQLEAEPAWPVDTVLSVIDTKCRRIAYEDSLDEAAEWRDIAALAIQHAMRLKAVKP